MKSCLKNTARAIGLLGDGPVEDEQTHRDHSITRDDLPDAEDHEVIEFRDLVDRQQDSPDAAVRGSVYRDIFLHDYHEGQNVGEQLVETLCDQPEQSVLILGFYDIKVMSTSFAEPCFYSLVKQVREELQTGSGRHFVFDGATCDSASIRTTLTATLNRLDYPFIRAH